MTKVTNNSRRATRNHPRSARGEQRVPLLHRGLIRALYFVLLHQYRPDGVYYLPNAGRALGGIRESLSSPEVRMDHVQHSLMAFLGAMESIEGSRFSGGR